MVDTLSQHETLDRRTISEDAHVLMLNRVSWGAIFAGVALALVVQVLLSLLGIGIGIATLDPHSADNPSPSSFSIAGGIWYLVSGLIAAFVGGLIASRMSGKTDPAAGALHGLTTWAFTTLLVLYLLTTTVGSLAGGVFSGVANAIGGLGQSVSQAAAPVLANANPLDAIDRGIRSSGTDPEALRNAASDAVRALVTGDESQKADAREKAAAALAAARNVPIEQAKTQIAQLETQYNEQVQKAKKMAEDAAAAAATVISTGALLAFVALVLGAVAGWFGGKVGTIHPVSMGRTTLDRRP
jgi:hypothetical protein